MDVKKCVMDYIINDVNSICSRLEFKTNLITYNVVHTGYPVAFKLYASSQAFLN